MRPGGTADKAGGRYEARWTALQIIGVLTGRLSTIRIEPVGEDGKGIEFLVERSGVEEAHQVKRQNGSGNWTLKRLRDEGMIDALRAHVAAGREFHFVSSMPAVQLVDLAGRARSSDDLDQFHQGNSKELKGVFIDFAGGGWESPEDAFAALRVFFPTTVDERVIDEALVNQAALLVDGAEAASVASDLAAIATSKLSVTLDAPAIWKVIEASGLRPKPTAFTETASQLVALSTTRWVRSVERGGIEPAIERTEAQVVAEHVLNDDCARIVVSAGAGYGKSSVLLQACRELGSRGVIVCACRLDRLRDARTAKQYGHELDMPASPVLTLAAAAAGRPCVLVIDQLDAVSDVSGRAPDAYDVVEELFAQAELFPEMRVVVGVRSFDLLQDSRLRQLTASLHPVAVEPLSRTRVCDAVSAMGVDPDVLSEQQLELLSVPLNLVLLQTVAAEAGALSFVTTKDLYDKFWTLKRRACDQRAGRTVDLARVLKFVVDHMSASQRLFVPAASLENASLSADADTLASEHLLVRDGSSIALFHESFFDYAFARFWVDEGGTLVEFLEQHGQDLFRRGQVRQVLLHMRDDDDGRFRSEIRALLASDAVRFHIKHSIASILRGLHDPTKEDWDLVAELAPDPAVVVTTPAWFDLLLGARLLDAWFTGDDSDVELALRVALSTIETKPDEVATLLGRFESDERFDRWLRFVLRPGDVGGSRDLTDLVIRSIRRGLWNDSEEELFGVLRATIPTSTTAAVELFRVWLVERPGALTVGDGRTLREAEVENWAIPDVVAAMAKRAPTEFCDHILPVMLQMMELAESENDELPRTDRYFSWRLAQKARERLCDALLQGAVASAAAVLQDRAQGVALLGQLAASDYDGAQYILFGALIPNAQAYRDEIADLMQQGGSRFECGYSDSSYWRTCELLRVASPQFADEQFAAVEATILDYVSVWEARRENVKIRGNARLDLLSSLEGKRLSPAARRHLGELQRRFNRSGPPKPEGVRMGTVRSPIPEDKQPHMRDEHWLRAFAQYEADERDWDDWGDFLKGGARELSNSLAKATEQDPTRFARLGLQLTADYNRVYCEAILQGLGQTKAEVATEDIVAFLRHVVALEFDEDVGRWFGSALRAVTGDVPPDLVEVLIELAASGNPVSAVSGRDDPLMLGMNSVAGSNALALGDVLLGAESGEAAGIVAPRIREIVSSDEIGVRACAAHAVANLYRFEPEASLAAFDELIDTDDTILLVMFVQRFIGFLINAHPERADAILDRMIVSDSEKVRQMGGVFSAHVALRREGRDLEGSSQDVRVGYVESYATNVTRVADQQRAVETIVEMLRDEDAAVRDAASTFVSALRGEDLQPWLPAFDALLESSAFEDAMVQLVITLDSVPVPPIDLVLVTTRKLVEVNGNQVGNIAYSAAGHGSQLGGLLLRAYGQSRSSADRDACLDAIDLLLEVGAYGLADAVLKAER